PDQKREDDRSRPFVVWSHATRLTRVARDAFEGKVDPELASRADAALDLDPAAVLGNDAVGEAQTEAGSAADRLGGEERVEDLREDIGGDAAAVVLHFDDHLITYPARGDLDLAGGLAGRLDRLHAVHEQVEEDLVDLRGRAFELRHRRKVAVHGDTLPRQYVANHRQALVDRLVDVDLADLGPVDLGE